MYASLSAFWCLILLVPWVGLLSMIEAFPGHTHLLFGRKHDPLFYLFNITPERGEVFMLVTNDQLSGFSPLLISKLTCYYLGSYVFNSTNAYP